MSVIFTGNPLISFRRNKNIRDNLVRSAPQNLPAHFLALVLVVTRVRSSTPPHPFPDLNPISLFGTILHAPPPTSFTAFPAVNVVNFTSAKRADVYLTIC